jgi:hypothetical protein
MKEALCRAFCAALDVERVPSGFAITTPYRFDDGDPIILYAVTVRHGFYRLEDSGVQIPMIEGSGATLSDGTRGEGFKVMLGEYDLEFDKDEMVVRTAEVSEEEIGGAALKLLAFMLRLQDFMLLTPERVRQTWQEDALKSLHETFDLVATVEEHAPVFAETSGIPADAVVHFHEADAAPLAVFLATTDSKGLQALVLKMELEKYQGKSARVVLLVELAKKNPLLEPTYALAQARLDNVLAYRGVEADTMGALKRYAGVDYGRA